MKECIRRTTIEDVAAIMWSNLLKCPKFDVDLGNQTFAEVLETAIRERFDVVDE